MRQKTGRFLINLMGVLLLLSIIPFTGYAAAPQAINYQGYLTDSGGAPINGTVQMTFAIYNVVTGGTALWNEAQNVDVSEGVYNVTLGAVTPINLPFDIDYWLGVAVEADAEMTPRQAFTSVGYTFSADESDTAYDLNCTGCVSQTELDFTPGTGDITGVAAGTGLSGGGTSGDVTVNADTTYLQRRVSSSCTAGSSIRVVNTDGTVTCEADDVGTGDITGVTAGTGLNGGGTSGSVTLNVDVPLYLSGSSSYTIEGENTSTAVSARGLYGLISSTSPGGLSAGVRGENSGTGGSGIGVHGSHAGSGWGVYGYTPGGRGVYGSSSSGTGVYGNSSSSTGVYGNSSTGYGVRGYSSSFYGVYGSNSSGNYGYLGSDSYGVRGDNSSSGNYGYLGASNSGVAGNSSSASSRGVYGTNSSSGYGVYGVSSTGRGVYGVNSSTGNYGYLGGSNYGVYGSNSSSGTYGYLGSSTYGVRGDSSSNIGVYGSSFSSYGVSGYSFSYIGVRGNGATYDFYAGGTGTNYGPFTGGHEVRLSNDFPVDIQTGMIVSVTGKALIRKKEDGSISISSTLPTVKLSDKADDKAVFGVYDGETPLGEDHWHKALEGERFARVNALGEGRVLVSNINGDIEAGDYITTSGIPGYGHRQNDDILHSYTLGKAIETIDWNSVTDTVDYNGKTYKVYLLAVVYTSG